MRSLGFEPSFPKDTVLQTAAVTYAAHYAFETNSKEYRKLLGRRSVSTGATKQPADHAILFTIGTPCRNRTHIRGVEIPFLIH